MSDLSPSEAIYGFAGWLTSRQQPVTMSSSHDAGIVAELVDDYCKSQGFAEPVGNWQTHLKPGPSA